LTSGLSCGRREGPLVVLDHAKETFEHGDLIGAQREAEAGYQRFVTSAPDSAIEFKALEAEVLLWRGMYPDALHLLQSTPTPTNKRGLRLEWLALEAAAYARLHRFHEAEEVISQADANCAIAADVACGAVFRARGVLAVQRGEFEDARHSFLQSLDFARTHGDRFLEATALLNLGLTSLQQERFDEAVDWTRASYEASLSLQAEGEAQKALGNLGWAYYKLGDIDRSLDLSLQAERRAQAIGNIISELSWITNAGYAYAGARNSERAKQSFLRALALAKKTGGKADIYNALRALARLSLLTGELDQARSYADEARGMALESDNRSDELYPLLVQGQVAARRGHFAEAEKTFQQVERDPVCPIFLKWESQHWLARLYEDEKQPNEAVREYQAALATFESARDTVRHQDFQLSFLTNAASIYDDYIHFLVSQGKSDEALRWADYSRARTLSEGLGLLSKGALKGERAGPPPLRAQEISQRAKGTLLFYWLGEKQSYLWAITPHKTSLFPLPPAAEIDALVQRYRKAINGPQDVLTSSEEARSLYRTLIVPAQSLLAHDGKVFIIPDGSLNNLNFETLVVPTPTEAKSAETKPAEPKPHFWIEDADVVNASSLRLLAASFSRDKVRANVRQKNPALKLLLIGDSVAPSKDYPELPRAAEQMASVSRHFPEAKQQVYQHKQATPAAYLASNPEQFSHIHFVAHGTASRLSPLDSAIVLSPPATDTGSFKLYARDIIVHPLQADLVTISACYGAGERAYSGEGLVGLAWAFLRAGAHNVIAGLWEVTDASTEQLMDRFYDELGKGASPDAALRTAKLFLLHNGAFRNPFYWAPFQLYAGS
jgi:CHAT domain-containing protein